MTSHLPPETSGGAIVYCATRRQSEEVAEYLQSKEIAADYFQRGPPAGDQEGCAAPLHRG